VPRAEEAGRGAGLIGWFAPEGPNVTTATKAPPKKREKRVPRQKSLPGMAPPKNKELEALALKFVERREEWSGRKQPMIDARDLLETRMKQLGLDRYEFDGNEIVLEREEHVIVRRKKKGKGEDAE
jgi:hypothetical protein